MTKDLAPNGIPINLKSEHPTFKFANVPSYTKLKFSWTQDLAFTLSGMFLVSLAVHMRDL